MTLHALLLAVMFTAATPPDTAQQFGLNIAQYASIIVAFIALAGTFISRKIKSPADELARADFAFKKITERLDEVNKDRAYLQSVIDTLRAQLTKFDNDASISMDDRRKLRLLVTEGEDRIRELVEENEILQERLTGIADKVRRGQPITLSDVYGEDDTALHTPGIDEMELTVSPQDHATYRSDAAVAKRKDQAK